MSICSWIGVPDIAERLTEVRGVTVHWIHVVLPMSFPPSLIFVVCLVYICSVSFIVIYVCVLLCSVPSISLLLRCVIVTFGTVSSVLTTPHSRCSIRCINRLICYLLLAALRFLPYLEVFTLHSGFNHTYDHASRCECRRGSVDCR